jgi:hypothetical protein
LHQNQKKFHKLRQTLQTSQDSPGGEQPHNIFKTAAKRKKAGVKISPGLGEIKPTGA